MKLISKKSRYRGGRVDHELERTRKQVARGVILRTIAFVLIAVLFLVNLFTQVFPIARYYGNGMEPSLSGGQLLLLRKTKDVEQGDVIAFYYNNKVLVRRVICEGGQQLAIEDDGSVYVNGALLDEPYLLQRSVGQCNLTFPYYVASGYVFVMGDNRVTAMDSRLSEIGPVPVDRIIGKVILAL